MSLWPVFLGMGGAAVAAGALALPAARRLAFGSVAHDWLGHQLEFDHVEPDGCTVRMKDGSVCRAWRLAGQAYDTKPEAAQTALHQGRSLFVHRVASAGAAVRLIGVKRRADTAHPAVWPSPALQEIGDAEAALFTNSFALRWYVLIAAAGLRQLEEADEAVAALLAVYRPERLHRVHDRCPLTGFLSYLVTGELRDDLAPVSADISACIPAADLLFDRDDGQLTTRTPAPHVHRVLAVRDWPDQVSGHLLHDILHIPGEIEVAQVCLPTSKELALASLKRRETAATFGLFTAAGPAAEEATAAQALLAEGKTSWLATQMAVIVRGDTPAEAEALVAEVARVLANWRVSYSVETKGTPVVWFNRHPGRDQLLRPLKLFAEDIAALWPFQAAPAGLTESQFGPGPLRSFATASGQSYAFQFQCSARPKSLGNFVVFAPSNSGKSTLILHLLSGLARHDGVRSYIFDSKEGARFMVEAMGGVYQSFDRLALNPLDTGADTPIIRQRLALLLRSMLGEAGEAEDTGEILDHVIETAFRLPIEQRTLNGLFGLTFPARHPARRAMGRWVVDDKGKAGLYSHVFNAPRDSLAGFLSGSFMTGINMNEALEDPALGPPVVSHIATTIERIALAGQGPSGGRGFAIFVDEAANLLRNEAFRQLVTVMFREYRKLGGLTGLAFQDPDALVKSGIADAVRENASAFFFFPNPQGNRAAYESFNLNEEQQAFIWSQPQGRRVLLVKRDAATGFDESVILDIDLAPLGEALRFYRSGPDAVRELQAIQSQWGDAWRDHI